MKTIFLYTLLLFTFIACKNDKESELKSPSNLRKYNFKPVESDLTDIAFIPNKNGKVYVSKNKNEWDQKQLEITAKLKNVDIQEPATIVTNNQVKDANEKYLAFKKKYSNDPVLPIFKARYAKIILEDYKLLSSNDYANIAFYTKELLSSSHIDKPIILTSLKKLKENNSSDFSSVKDLAISTIDERTQSLENFVTILKKGSPKIKGGGLKEDFLKQLHERTIVDKEKELKEYYNFLKGVQSI